MNIVDGLIILGVVVVVAFIAAYLKRVRKRGNKCVGCPHSMECCRRLKQDKITSCE